MTLLFRRVALFYCYFKIVVLYYKYYNVTISFLSDILFICVIYLPIRSTSLINWLPTANRSSTF